MTAASLLPLAAKGTVTMTMTQPSSSIDQTLRSNMDQTLMMTNLPTANITTKPKSMTSLPVVRPHQSLLMFPEVLVRASVAETLMQRQAQAQALQAPASALLQTTMAFANYKDQGQQQQTLHQQLQQQLQLQLELQKIPASPIAPVKNIPASLQHLQQQPTEQENKQRAKKDIIGMGICIPKAPIAQALGPAPSRPKLVPAPSRSRKTQESVKKMMMIGNPLKAPPPLAKKIFKKRLSATLAPSANSFDNAPVAKRRKVEQTTAPAAGVPRRVSLGSGGAVTLQSPQTTAKILSPDELEFLQAAQRLHEISSPPNSPKTRSPVPHIMANVLTSKALKPPPSFLGF